MRQRIYARIKHTPAEPSKATQPDGLALVTTELTTIDALGIAVGEDQGNSVGNDPATWPTRTAPIEILLTSLPEDHGTWKITSVEKLRRALQGYTGL